MAEPNVLLLDEPTNDLDIDTLQQLEDLLDGWAGTLVVISHDRYLIERICDSTWALFGDGRLTNLPGGIEEYLRRRRSNPARPARTPAQGAVPNVAPGAVPIAAQPAPSAPPVNAATYRAARKELARLERAIARLDARERELHEELATAATDQSRLAVLDAELKRVVEEKDSAEARWLELAADHE